MSTTAVCVRHTKLLAGTPSSNLLDSPRANTEYADVALTSGEYAGVKNKKRGGNVYAPDVNMLASRGLRGLLRAVSCPQRHQLKDNRTSTFEVFDTSTLRSKCIKSSEFNS